MPQLPPERVVAVRLDGRDAPWRAEGSGIAVDVSGARPGAPLSVHGLPA